MLIYPFPTALYLIGKMFNVGKRPLAIYANSHILGPIKDHLDMAGEKCIPVSITASKVLKAAVLIGTVCEVTDHEKKWSALENIGDVLPLQWENARRVRDYEYKMMRALRVAIDLDKSHMHASGPSWNRMRG
ncbi:hypothetical protein EYZ11_002929 [Aspergillus tanneri]|uniref:Uncharacterized protein n=1 Tax=Aspergillus tanneri TaxID=1220188 RepID=A0A4V3UQ40_9EURO|nr:hypothetical protein EYZ11_002929 [Aspergillus tanneri]